MPTPPMNRATLNCVMVWGMAVRMADRKNQRRGEEHPSTPQSIAEISAEKSSDDAADEDHTHREPQLGLVHAEVGFQGRHRAADDARVITEQKSAYRRCESDQPHVGFAEVRFVWGRAAG